MLAELVNYAGDGLPFHLWSKMAAPGESAWEVGRGRAARPEGGFSYRNATIIEHLGDAYWHVGRKREARFQWERALNQKPDKDRLPVIKDKLENGLSAANDKPTVYEKPAEAKQGG